jgi:hypothetical protein
LYVKWVISQRQQREIKSLHIGGARLDDDDVAPDWAMTTGSRVLVTAIIDADITED